MLQGYMDKLTRLYLDPMVSNGTTIEKADQKVIKKILKAKSVLDEYFEPLFPKVGGPDFL